MKDWGKVLMAESLEVKATDKLCQMKANKLLERCLQILIIVFQYFWKLLNDWICYDFMISNSYV